MKKQLMGFFFILLAAFLVLAPSTVHYGKEDVSHNLKHLLYPTTYNNLYKAGWEPAFFNQQWGGAHGGEQPHGGGADVWFETGYIPNDGTVGNSLGHHASGTWAAQSFKVSQAITVNAVWVKLFKEGNPQKDAEPLIAYLASAIPNGSSPTLVTNGTSNAINGHDLVTAENWPITSNNDGEWYKFTFASNPSLSANTTYYLVMKATGADAVNYFRWKFEVTSGAAVASYPFGTRWTGDDATPTTWSADANRDLNFLIEATAATQMIQASGEFANKINFVEGNQSQALSQPYVNFSDPDEFTMRWIVDAGMTASKTFIDIHYGMDHDRIRVYTDATPNLCVEVTESDGTQHTITDGDDDVSSGKHDFMVSVRHMNDGSDHVKLIINGAADGTQVSDQSIGMDDNFAQLATYHMGGGFPAAPTWTDDQSMAALPSADPDWVWDVDAGTPTEANGMTVQNNKLYQNGVAYANDYGRYYAAAPTFTNAAGWVITWKQRIIEASNTLDAQAHVVNVADDTIGAIIAMHEYYVQDVSNLNTEYQIDLTDKEHTFLLMGKGSDYFLYIDGSLIFDGTANFITANATDSIYWGDNSNGAGLDADVVTDYFKFYNTAWLPYEVNDCTISEFSYWSGDMTGLAATAYNSGSPKSTKQLAGVKEDVVKVVLKSVHLRGITRDPTTTSTSPVLLTDMEHFVLTHNTFNIDFHHTTYNSGAGNECGLMSFIDGADRNKEPVGGVGTFGHSAHGVSKNETLGYSDEIKPLTGLHKYEVRWEVNAGTQTSSLWRRTLDILQ